MDQQRMHRWAAQVAVVAAATAAAWGASGWMVSARADAPPPRFEERACDIATSSPEVAQRLRCGVVRVPRDAERAQDGHFELAVVVKRSAQPRAGAAPVLILHGGPGGQQTPYMGRGSADLVPGHDTVAFDMRGGGRTGPRFCEPLQKDLASAQRQRLQGAALDAARAAALSRCVESFRAQGLRPEHFGTARNVADAEAVRQALSIPRWAVYSMSYGTTVAAEYAGRHPQSLTSVVLDSPYPPDALVPSVREAQRRAIGSVLAECQRDRDCSARFATLTTDRADAALRGLATAPLQFLWGGESYTADEVATRAALHGLMYSETTALTVPWFLDAVVRADGAAIAAALALPWVMGEQSDSSGSSAGGLLATDCRDRSRHHQLSQPGDLTWMQLLGGLPNGSCAAWPLGAEPALPAPSAVPVLVLTAAYDGFQPDGAAMAQQMGPLARAVSVPRAAHVVRGAGACPRRLVADFLRDPTVALDTACLADMPSAGFLLDAHAVPALALAGPPTLAGKPPAPVVGAVAGTGLWLLAGVVVPLVGALRARWRSRRLGAAAVPAKPRGRASGRLALLAGVAVVLGAGVPVAGTHLGHPGAAVYGLHPGLHWALWLLPVALVLAAAGIGVGVKARHWSAAVAAAAAGLAALSALTLGLTPW